MTPSPSASLPDRIRGCLLAGAVGDALGAEVEFMSRGEILAEYGPAGVTGLVPAYGKLGAITDDTQMTLFTAEALLDCAAAGTLDDLDAVAVAGSIAYLRWLSTQRGRPSPLLAGIPAESSALLGERELHASRAPGNTCLSALGAMPRLGAQAKNTSKGCGTVMRLAPVGACAAASGRDTAWTFRVANRLGGLTHGHSTGILAGGAHAVIVHRVLLGDTLETAAAEARRLLLPEPGSAETLAALDEALRLAASGPASPATLSRLGGGWIAEEALAIGLYAALVAPDLPSALLLAVNHDGDSDSTGLLAGNLLGARDGESAIPAAWLAPLELRPVTTRLADALASIR